jgi:BlaI family penicillinase repressor
MARIEEIPTESEWQIMEVLWSNQAPMTSKAVIQELHDISSMTPKMIRVLMNRLCEKGILTYTVDPNDKRIYHYSVLKSREECQREKSRKFVDSFFKGSQTNAVAALLQSASLTEEQIKELEEILEKSKGKGEE